MLGDRLLSPDLAGVGRHKRVDVAAVLQHTQHRRAEPEGEVEVDVGHDVAHPPPLGQRFGVPLLGFELFHRGEERGPFGLERCGFVDHRDPPGRRA